MPRAILFTPAKKDLAGALFEVGATRRAAARVLGVTEGCIRYHLARDPHFAERVAHIAKVAVPDPGVVMTQKASRSWRAAVSALEILRNEIEGPLNTDAPANPDPVQTAEVPERVQTPSKRRISR